MNETSSSNKPISGLTNSIKQTPLLEDNLNNYSLHLSFLAELVSKLEKIGHTLHDTNFPEDTEKAIEPYTAAGKLYQLQGMNHEFLKLNQRFNSQIEKLNNLI